jgi:hypothetical protein
MWWISACIITAIVFIIAWAPHPFRWISRKGENPAEKHKVNDGVAVFAKHYGGEWRNQWENHKYFPRLYKILFAITDIVKNMIARLCRGIAHVAIKLIAAAPKIASHLATVKDKISSLMPKIEVTEISEETYSQANLVADELSGKVQTAERKKAEAEALKIYEDNFAKNDPPLTPEPKTSWETIELTGNAPFNSSDVLSVLERNFSDKPTEDVNTQIAVEKSSTDLRTILAEKFEVIDEGLAVSIDEFAEKCRLIVDAKITEAPKAPAPILLLTDQTAAINDSGVSDAEVKTVLIAKASAEAAAESGPVINLPDNSTQALPKEKIAEPEILAVVDETPVIIDGEKIVVDEKPASVKIAQATPATTPQPLLKNEGGTEPKAIKAEIIPPKIAKAAIPKTETIDKEIEKLIGEIQNPKTQITVEEKMNFLNRLKQLLGMKKSLGNSARVKAVFEESVIGLLTAEAADNYNKAAKLDEETITKENSNLDAIPLLLEKKLRVAELKLGYAKLIEEKYGNKKLTSRDLLTEENRKSNAKI